MTGKSTVVILTGKNDFQIPRLLALPHGAAEVRLPYASSTISFLWSDDICTLLALGRRGFCWRGAMAQRRTIPRRSNSCNRRRSLSAKRLLHGAGQWRRFQNDRLWANVATDF